VSLPGAHPNGMAVDPESGNIFVTGRDTNTVYVLDRSLKVVKRIPVGKLPFGITFMDGYVHVANFGSGSVTVINARTLETISNPPGRGPAPETASIQNEDSAPTFIAADPPRGRVVVALNGPQEVYRRYAYLYGLTAEGALRNWASVNDLPGGAYGIATLPSRARAYVSHRDASALMAVNTERAELVEGESLRGLPFVPYLVAALDATKTVYVTHNAPGQPADAPQQISQYLVLEGQAPRLMKTVTVGELGPGGGALAIYPWPDDMWRPGSPFDGSVWVGTRDRVTVFDPTLVELRTFGPADGIVGQPSAIAADPVLRRVYVSEGETGRIVVLAGW
jgi:YVTN family beta-propeller protein